MEINNWPKLIQDAISYQIQQCHLYLPQLLQSRLTFLNKVRMTFKCLSPVPSEAGTFWVTQNIPLENLCIDMEGWRQEINHLRRQHEASREMQEN